MRSNDDLIFSRYSRVNDYLASSVSYKPRAADVHPGGLRFKSSDIYTAKLRLPSFLGLTAAARYTSAIGAVSANQLQCLKLSVL